MATSSKTSTRKASRSTATSTSGSTEDTTPTVEDPAGGDDTTESSTSAVTEQGADPAAGQPEDLMAQLKRRVRTTQHIADTRPDDLTDEQRMNLVGAPASSLPGPRTLASPASPTRQGEEYVTADSDGYVAWVPKNIHQPATVRVWVAGQRVRKDVHEALSPVAAATPQDARVLSADEYAQLAPYL